MTNAAAIAPKIDIQKQAALTTHVSTKRQVQKGHGLEP